MHSCAGIHGGSKLLVMPLPSQAEISAIQSVPDQRIRGFDEELHSVMRRRQTHAAASTLPSGKLLNWSTCLPTHF